MDAIQNILERVSVAQLTGPDISAEQKDILFRAALRAPDHAWLRPSRYLTLEGDARQYVSEVYYQSLPDKAQLSDEKTKKMRNRLLRAPLIVVAITRVQEHYKVPRDEQLLSTGAGIQNMLNAVHALGLGAIWRTGDMAENTAVKAELGLSADEIITGFVYIGHINTAPKSPPAMPVAEYVRAWTPEKP
ncbi:MAG TPA: nitroreductase [Oceanospirillales bacterium]|nr:nitroreductase [Oceanospirillales bacterium]